MSSRRPKWPRRCFASRFTETGREFADLVEAVQRSGTVAAVEFLDRLLIDGRDRVRAVDELRRQGIDIELRP